MATANFKTMHDFPLIAANDVYSKICPECGLSHGEDDDKCSECGCDLTDVEVVVDDWACEDIYKMMVKAAERMNDAQPFYKVTVESGYYCGAQFYVEDLYDGIEDFTNEYARDEFGLCRSEMLRRYKVAGNKIRKALYAAKDELGLDELVCIGRFSNGEAVYEKVDSKKGLTLRQKAKAAIAAA